MRSSHTAVITGIALAAGFGLGRWTLPGPPPPVTADPSAHAASDKPSSGLGKVAVSQLNLGTLTTALQSMDVGQRQRSLAELGREWGERDPVQGWTMLRSIPGLADRQSFAETLIEAWARRDLHAALGACGGLPAGELRAVAFAKAASVWARQSPQQAADFAARDLSGSARSSALVAIVQEWAQQQPQSAAAWCLAQSENVQSHALPEVLRFWANTDPQNAVQWAGTLPEGSRRTSAVEAVVSEWADQYPAEAAAWVQKMKSPSALAETVGQTWAASDPEAAARWAFEAGLSETLLPVLATWATADAKAAFDWMTNHAGTDNGDELRFVVLQAWGNDDPAAALAQAQRLTNPAAREKTVQALLADWQEREPEAAATWLRAK